MSDPALTELIHRANHGDTAAVDALFEESYPILVQLARARLRAHVRTPTLDTGSLVHEAYLRFVSAGRLRIEDSLHFRRWAGRVMRSVIVDLARRRQAERRGGHLVRLQLTTDLAVAAPEAEETILRINEALETFAEVDRRAAHIVELRYFAGLTETEISGVLGVSDRTVRRDWEKARLILAQMLQDIR